MSFTSLDFGTFIKITKYWTDFKSIIASKALSIQYEEDSSAYYIFAIDNSIVYISTIYKGTVPDPNNYSQVTNNTDKTDWTTNYQSSGNTRTIESSTISNTIATGALETTTFSSNPYNWNTSNTAELTIDPAGSLTTRSNITTDAISYFDDFLGTNLYTTLTGTLTFTNGSVDVTGSGTKFLSEIIIYNSIKASVDSDACYNGVADIISDTQLQLNVPYTGASGSGRTGYKTVFIPVTGSGGSVTVATSNLNLSSGVTNGSITGVYATFDYPPIQLSAYLSLSQRTAQTKMVFGLQDSFTATPSVQAIFIFDGTDNTKCKVQTISYNSVDDTQTDTITLPLSTPTTATENQYTVVVNQDIVIYYISDQQVAMHKMHVPTIYGALTYVAYVQNTGVPASATIASICTSHIKNYEENRITAINFIPQHLHATIHGPQLEGSLATLSNPILIGGSDGTYIHGVAMDNTGRLIIAPTSSNSAAYGTADGMITVGTTARIAIFQTTYTEQTSGAQRSIKSANNNDSSAGTGARTIKITYLDSTMSNIYTETITLNGTTFVNTVNTNICYIEKIEVMTVGSTGATVGIVSLYATTGGTGTVIWSIAAGETKTYGSHHYAQVGKTCNIVSITAGASQYATTFSLRAQSLGANTVNQQITDSVHNYGGTGNIPFSRNYTSPIRVIGPAHIQMFIDPDQNTSTTYYGSFDYYDS
jgi:hypothetical protein